MLLLLPVLGQGGLDEAVPAACREVPAGLGELQEVHAHQTPALGCPGLDRLPLGMRRTHGESHCGSWLRAGDACSSAKWNNGV